jgi:hypothetical protein
MTNNPGGFLDLFLQDSLVMNTVWSHDSSVMSTLENQDFLVMNILGSQDSADLLSLKSLFNACYQLTVDKYMAELAAELRFNHQKMTR